MQLIPLASRHFLSYRHLPQIPSARPASGYPDIAVFQSQKTRNPTNPRIGSAGLSGRDASVHVLAELCIRFLSIPPSSSPKMIPTKATIAVPSEDPKKKKEAEKPEEDGTVANAKKTKEEEKDGEDLVRTHPRALKRRY